MWIMLISLLFLWAPQVFLKSILILIPVKIGVSDFANRTVWFWSPDISGIYTGFQKVFPDLFGNLPGHVRSLNKKSQVDHNLPFWFISSTHLDLCDYVKILRCLKEEGGIVEEVFVMDYLSMWSWAKLLPIAEKGEALK
jgi:hypothetical protein